MVYEKLGNVVEKTLEEKEGRKEAAAESLINSLILMCVHLVC